jgi:hypothetical protein
MVSDLESPDGVFVWWGRESAWEALAVSADPDGDSRRDGRDVQTRRTGRGSAGATAPVEQGMHQREVRWDSGPPIDVAGGSGVRRGNGRVDAGTRQAVNDRWDSKVGRADSTVLALLAVRSLGFRDVRDAL